MSSDVCSSDLIEILPSVRNLQDDPETVVSPDHRRYRSPRLNGYSLRIGMGSEDSRVGWFCDRLVTRARGRRGWPSRQVAAVGSVRPADRFGPLVSCGACSFPQTSLESRSEERRAGTECVSRCSSRSPPYTNKNN